MACAYTIYQYENIVGICTVPCDISFIPSHSDFYILPSPTCCIYWSRSQFFISISPLCIFIIHLYSLFSYIRQHCLAFLFFFVFRFQWCVCGFMYNVFWCVHTFAFLHCLYFRWVFLYSILLRFTYPINGLVHYSMYPINDLVLYSSPFDVSYKCSCTLFFSVLCIL